jgi:hypothetical protein
MNKYKSAGFNSVRAETINEAAMIFADRAARRKYGRAGYCRTCNQQCHAQDMSFAEYSAFIGSSTGRNETTGTNLQFTVYTA